MRSAAILIAFIAAASASPLSAKLESVTTQDVFDHLISAGKVKPTDILEDGKVVGNRVIVDDKLFTETREELVKSAAPGTSPAAVSTLTKRDNYSYSCYNSGSWAKQRTLQDAAQWLCSQYNYASFAGQWQAISTDSHYGNSAGDAMRVKGSARFVGPDFNTRDQCINAYNKFLDDAQSPCHGRSQDTRGGSITLNRPETRNWATYEIDPTTDNCNC